MPLELQDINPVLLDVNLPTGELQVSHQRVDLAGHGDGVLARTAESMLRFELTAPTGWQLEASHEDDEGRTIAWLPSVSGIAHEFPDPTTDPLELTVTATNSTGEKKKRKIYIEAKPDGALPDRQ